MQEVFRLDEQFHIIADTDRTTTPLRVLKHGDSFAVFDQHGDIVADDIHEHGCYHGGTRFLSRFELLLSRRRLLLLSSTVSSDNASFTASLTNPDILRGDQIVIPRGEIHFLRSRVLAAGSCVDRVRITNYALRSIELPITFTFDADFADVFEVRGTQRAQRGERLPDAWSSQGVIRYRGLDGVERRSRIRWSQQPEAVAPGLATFILTLEPHATTTIEMNIGYESGPERCDRLVFDAALDRVKRELKDRGERRAGVVSSNESLNRWIRRSSADLQMMVTDTPSGPYPYAGIPWFSTPFGRDGIITALELLWADPEVARGVLAFLADMQATSYDDARDAQPGKILHEMRGGEMAALGEIPFGRYYGTCDATPLFVTLAAAYFERTGDLASIDRIWPHILAALDWMQSDGDPDGDGFLEYARRSATGLVQQGWKDSQDSVFHANGVLADPPIALCEVQGYAYSAWLGAAGLAAARNDPASAAEWQHRAERLRERFETAFWCDDLGTYALALDGDKRPCRVRSSNPGHCLFSGIASVERARRVARTLMSEHSIGGWGIRTITAGESRYNPMSYHNGSIWPHDNALVAAGLARYGLTPDAMRVLTAMFDLSQVVDLNRLPELICGFDRRGDEHPTLYPVACAPQAWAAGAVYLLLQASLGLHIDARQRRIAFSRAVLPEPIDWILISNLSIGDASVDLRVERHPADVGITVMRRKGDVEIVSIK